MNIFTHYFQRARHLCVYQYQLQQALPIELIFPYTTRLTLIDCSRLGISNLLYPHRFPKLEQIHYLSGHPGTYTIHNRFPTSVQWVFPNRDYSFYNCMLEAGFGTKSDTIVAEHIYSISIHNNITSFDIHIPGYGRKEGLLYKKHMNDYFYRPEIRHILSKKELLPVDEKETLHRLHTIHTHEHSSLYRYERLCLEQDVINHILKDA
jgi:hypothetical protein